MTRLQIYGRLTPWAEDHWWAVLLDDLALGGDSPVHQSSVAEPYLCPNLFIS